MIDTNQLTPEEQNDIFHNLSMIIKIHEQIGETLSLKFPAHQHNLQNMIEAYADKVLVLNLGI
jgi:ABC-type Zn uptake system ZnuABC Zn-binding protein ZnuA